MLNSLVEADQTGFIPGRLIQTNISTVRDLTDYTEETTGRSGALIFLDWEKAYDRLERSFLEKTMVIFGIPEPFIKKVKTIYQNTLAAVQYKGRVSRFFECLEECAKDAHYHRYCMSWVQKYWLEEWEKTTKKKKPKVYWPAKTNDSKFLTSQMIQLWE